METIIRNSVYRLTAWRVAGDFFRMASSIAVAISQYLVSLERGAWQLESEAARVYEAATGVNPGFVVGEPTRYVRVSPEIEFEPEED